MYREWNDICSECSTGCARECFISDSAVYGCDALYSLREDVKLFGPTKKYENSFDKYNINGRVFGAQGVSEDTEIANLFSVRTECSLGKDKKIKCSAPFILPAIAKYNWRDYYAGAAMFGIPVVIGESAVRADGGAEYKDEKLLKCSILDEMINEYRKYQWGYGDIILQVNGDDIHVGTAEYALKNCDITAIEIKFGQAAKGIQHFLTVESLEKAQRIKKQGYIVMPDPFDEDIIEQHRKGIVKFMQYGRLPMFTEESLKVLIQKYKELGAEHIFFKMAGYSKEDIERIIKIAVDNKIDFITFDGAGGGTGHSPNAMMNEWGYPTVMLEQMICGIAKKYDKQDLPQMAIAGGIYSEDLVFKALALGEQKIEFVGIGRSAMAAAIKGKEYYDRMLESDKEENKELIVEKPDSRYREAEYLKSRYGNDISYGAVGVYSYLDRLNTGLKMFMLLNRKFRLDLLGKEDLIEL